MTTSTSAQPTGQLPLTAPPEAAPQPDKRIVQFGLPALCIGIVAVLILGFAGGIVAQSLLPAKTGSRWSGR
jgi:hypothetical protein